MFFLTIFRDLFKILRSNQSPNQIAGGFVLGMFLGLTPFWSLLNVLAVLLLIIVNVNIGAALMAYAFFSAVIYLFDPLINSLGYQLLVEMPALAPLWTSLYNAPVIPFTSFNNTVYLGSLVIYLLTFIPMFLLARKGLLVYRERYQPKVDNWKWVKWIKASKLYEWYDKLSFLEN